MKRTGLWASLVYLWLWEPLTPVQIRADPLNHLTGDVLDYGAPGQQSVNTRPDSPLVYGCRVDISFSSRDTGALLVITLEKSDRFRKLSWAAATVVIMAVSLYLLSLAMAVIGPGTSYAVWTGIGAILTMILGIVIYEEPAKLIRIFFILLIVAGVVGINLVSGVA